MKIYVHENWDVFKGQDPWDRILICIMFFGVWSKFCPKSEFFCLIPQNVRGCRQNLIHQRKYYKEVGLYNCFCKSLKKMHLCTSKLYPGHLYSLHNLFKLVSRLGEKKICICTVVGINKCCPKSIGPFPLLTMKYYWIYDKTMKSLF